MSDLVPILSDFAPILFVGLGNPGVEHAMTRHNMGYMVVQKLAQHLGYCLKRDSRFDAKIAKGITENRHVHLMLPLTYMNLSGMSIKQYSDYFKIPLQSIVVVVDDISLVFGRLVLRMIGSSGGHNGLKSVETSLQTTHYKRLRLGIGHPGEKVLASYVLETFNETELQKLPAFIDYAVEVLLRLLKERFALVMNSVNAP